MAREAPDAQVGRLYDAMCTAGKPDTTKVTVTLARLMDCLNFVSIPRITTDGRADGGTRNILSRGTLVRLVTYDPCREAEKCPGARVGTAPSSIVDRR